jgi:Flp pilus assembly protein TadG
VSPQYRLKLRSGLDVGDIRNWKQQSRRVADALLVGFSKGARDERGAVAIMFAIAIVVLVPLILGLFDVYTASEQRARLQDSLDAAALYAARSTYQTDAQINTAGNTALTANLQLLRGATLIASDFHLVNNNTKVTASATIQPMALAPAFWAHPAVTVNSEVIRNSKNLEVALVLDVTGSMNTGTRISDLRSAAQDLIDLVVKTQQTPYYSKAAVIPWSMGVNVGAYASQVRGAVTGTMAITNVTWKASAARNITGATKANPVVITSAAHGFVNGDKVYITGVNGMTQLNNKIFTVAGAAANTFQLSGVSGTAYSTYSSSGTVTKCVVATCDLVVTANAHGYANGDNIYINNVGGITSINDKIFAIANVTTNSFSLPSTVVAAGAYTAASGNSYCTKYGCEYYRFTAGDGSTIKVFQESTCVSERTGANAYTDVAPSTSPVGFNYPAPASGVSVAGYTASVPNPCLTNQIIPLSTDIAGLKAAIGGLLAAGSTGGQVGTAWGWYMLSPNFSYLWPSASQPAAYTAPDTLKVMVLMTDGQLNTAYCNGVIAKDSISGSGSILDHNNCNATNGDTFTQSQTLCANMKAAGVVIYTVGFDITGDVPAENLMTSCATDAAHEYLPTSGSALSDAFHAIGADINNLRLSH